MNLLLSSKRKIYKKIHSLFETIEFLVYREKKKIHKNDKICTNTIFYIIRFRDPQKCGWSVWERVILYNIAYALHRNWIPIVDMKNFRSIYQKRQDFRKVNVWDQFYEQPCNISLEKAMQSRNYILGNASKKWFNDIRNKQEPWNSQENLRTIFLKYIRLKKDIAAYIEAEYKNMFKVQPVDQPRCLGIVLRGTDYISFHHMKQPSVAEISEEARYVMKKYNCQYIFIATEDKNIYSQLTTELGSCIVSNKVTRIDYQQGELVGNVLSKQQHPFAIGLDYLTTLYILAKCRVLIGGLCGATIVAPFRIKDPYEYTHIWDLKSFY